VSGIHPHVSLSGRTVTAILTAQGVEKSFGLRRVLSGVSFALHEGDRVGLVGLNGSGKTTLLRLLVGEPGNEPDGGMITRQRGLTIEYVAQEPRLDPERTVEHAARDGLTIEDHELHKLAAALELPPLDATVGTLSIGERRRVALARALLARPRLLALDEPTNHLDARTTAWLEEWLRERAGTLLLVTHDRYFLDRVATRILEIDRGRVFAYEGGYTRFLEQQADRLDQENRRERERASFVRRELDWIRRGPAARTTKQQARIDRFDAAVAAKPGLVDRRPGAMSLELPMTQRLGKTILELRGLSKSAGGRVLFQDLDLIWKPGDRIGVVGPNGAGKTTLVRTILGQIAPDAGEVVVGVNTSFAFLDQGRADLRDDRTVLQEVAGENDAVFLPSGAIHARTFLRMMLFDDGFADTPVGALSGGERNRVQLAKLLRAGGNFLILDEPTNDLDLMTLGVLEEALANFPGCALVVSHDRWFLDRVATGILAFEGDGRVGFYEGSCSDYLARPRASSSTFTSTSTTTSTTTTTSRAPRVRPRKLTFKERQELSTIEQTILTAEQKVADLEQTLQNPAVYETRSAEVPSLVAALDAARHDVERLYARWQELDAVAAAEEPA
jgi:ABC transport system ATP-binding/permease protein